MLMNSLDPEVAERPQDLIVCGGAGKAARSWEAFDAIVAVLQRLTDKETLLVQSGQPDGVFRTEPLAPRVLIATANSAAGSWTYIGPQDTLQVTYETFAAAGRQHFGGSLAGKLVVSGGMGSRGGAQPLAATLNGAAFLGIEADPERINRLCKTGYCDILVNSLDEAVRILRNAIHKKEAVSVGLAGNRADILSEMVRRGIVPDLLTDQTGADDPLHGYIPSGYSIAQATEFRARDPQGYSSAALGSIATHAFAMLNLQRLGAVTFDSGNNIPPLFCEGRGPVLWVALSGDPRDIAATDDLALRLFPENESLTRWICLARKRVKFQGLPARACWLGHGELARFGLAVNDMVARGDLRAPIVIGSVVSNDGSDAIAGWSILHALLKTAVGASWVSVHNGGGAGQVTVAEGTAEGAQRLERVLTGDVGYEEARQIAARAGLL